MGDSTLDSQITDFTADSASAASQAQARRRIAEEHEALRTRLEELRELRDLERVVAVLEGLRPRLVDHFESEEAADGLHHVVEENAPHLLPSVQRVFEEHREFLATVDRLTAEAREAWNGPVKKLLAEIRSLCDGLHEHEATETELLTDSVYTDLGDSS